MAELIVVIAVCVAATWLCVAVVLGFVSVEEAHEHSHVRRCPDCHHRHVVRRGALVSCRGQ